MYRHTPAHVYRHVCRRVYRHVCAHECRNVHRYVRHDEYEHQRTPSSSARRYSRGGSAARSSGPAPFFLFSSFLGEGAVAQFAWQGICQVDERSTSPMQHVYPWLGDTWWSGKSVEPSNATKVLTEVTECPELARGPFDRRHHKKEH